MTRAPSCPACARSSSGAVPRLVAAVLLERAARRRRDEHRARFVSPVTPLPVRTASTTTLTRLSRAA